MSQTNVATWSVVGAGPAGILAVGKLIDAGIPAEHIHWFDPQFNVGDLGAYWYNVPSNTKVSLFDKFLMASDAFEFTKSPDDIGLTHLDQDGTCLLNEMVAPLQWVTETLKKKVNVHQGLVTHMKQADGQWQLTIENQNILSSHVILTIGATPNTLNLTQEINTLPLETTLNPELLAGAVKAGDKVAVFGASHSGVLVIKNLLELGCQVVNFYRSPMKYAIYQEDHIIYDNTGLKGTAAAWAKAHLNGQQTPNLTRHHVDQCDVDPLLADCQHVAFATGLTARSIAIEGYSSHDYDAHTGIIAPGVFGFGVAYPEQVTDRYNITEYSVGLFKFTKYIDRVLPIWLRY